MDQEIQKATRGMMKPSLIGRTELDVYLENRKDLKLRELNDLTPLRETFRYCLALVGIKKENLPTDAQKAVLIDFCINNLSSFTVSEIKHAFTLAVAGKLEVDANSYQSFNPVFVADILNAYKNYTTKKNYHMKELDEVKEKTQEEKDDINRAMMLDILNELNESFQNKVYLFSYANGIKYYNCLRYFNLMPDYKDKNLWDKAKKQTIDRFKTSLDKESRSITAYLTKSIETTESNQSKARSCNENIYKGLLVEKYLKDTSDFEDSLIDLI